MKEFPVVPHALNAIQFQNTELQEATHAIADCISSATDNLREIATILGKVKSSKCYADDGFLSVADYAWQVFGINKSSAYSLAKVGERFYISAPKLEEANEVAQEEYDQFIGNTPVYNLVPLTSLDDSVILAGVLNNKIDSCASQARIKKFVSSIKPAKSAKSEKLGTLYAYATGEPNDIGTKTWNEWVTELCAEGGEIARLPGGKNGTIRFVHVSNYRASYCEWVPEPASTKKEPTENA